MSNNRIRNRIRKDRRRQASARLRSEANARGIEPGSRAYVAWLALMRDHGHSMDSAKAQLDKWDAERNARLDDETCVSPDETQVSG